MSLRLSILVHIVRKPMIILHISGSFMSPKLGRDIIIIIISVDYLKILSYTKGIEKTRAELGSTGYLRW